MKVFNWNNIRLLLMFIVVIFLFSFTSKRNENRKLSKSIIIFEGNSTPFVRREAITKLLIENNTDVSSIRKVNLDLQKLEKGLNAQKMIEKSDVFVSVDGVLKAVIKQKTPIARVFDKDGSSYFDYQGSRMPLSINYTARVPLITGKMTSIDNEVLTTFLRFIYDDSFLKKNIIGIEIMPDGTITMLNRNFDYQINFGKVENMEQKFKNYKAFFQKAVLDSSLYKYRNIDLRFTEQVVCTK
ncbi:cell division protein FtsQ [Flavobacterium sp. PL11]|jgi:cell division protein FtsQ|uniref:cell division protein FtsQ/DivIB n=1 Tax=Flavobacterium sp. PL11 TaxID=3071717 RepID=UPI002DF77EDD|nr:cell division protein FtsQ [Flavobacterium sp. PL11]